MNSILMAAATEEEVRKYLFMIHPEKAPEQMGWPLYSSNTHGI